MLRMLIGIIIVGGVVLGVCVCSSVALVMILLGGEVLVVFIFPVCATVGAVLVALS